MACRREPGAALLLAIASLLAQACGGSGAATPTTPTVSVAEVFLTAAPDLVIPGDRFTLILNARQSTGGVKQVINDVTWRTSDLSVAEVSADGTVLARGSGSTEIRAAFGDKSAAITLRVVPTVMVIGRIHEAPPTETRVVANATVEVTSGRFQGTRVVSDAAGSFTLGPLAGQVSIRVSHPQFESSAANVVDLTNGAPAPLDIRLLPPQSSVAETYEGAICCRPVDAWTFNVHHPGTVEVVLDEWITPYDGDFIELELRDANTSLIRHRNCDYWEWGLHFQACDSGPIHLPLTLARDVAGGQRYELRLTTERRQIGRYRVRVRHPG